MKKLVALFAALLALVLALPAQAQVQLSFHSFNGSVLFGRYPHTFVVMEGTLEGSGKKVFENYGFTAKTVSPAILSGPVPHMILIEEDKYIRSTNRHFTIPIDDATYHQIRREVAAWREAPGDYYDLETRNCIHFVGTIAKMVGLKVAYPDKMLRKPKQWLNHVTRLNPQLRAREL